MCALSLVWSAAVGILTVNVLLGIAFLFMAQTESHIAQNERRAAEAPPPPRELLWPGGRARGFDWEGEPLPSAAQRVARVRDHMVSSEE